MADRKMRMVLLYKTCIGSVIFSGIAHMALTFIRYKALDANSLWFFSAGLALLFNGMLNISHLVVSSTFTYRMAGGANLALLVFAAVLSWHIRKAQVMGLLLVAVLLTVSCNF